MLTAIFGVMLQALSPTDAANFYFLDAMPIIALGFFISLLLIGILYMLGNFFQSQDLLTMAKDNVGALAFSAIIVLLFMFLFTTFSGLSQALVCGGECSNHLDAARQSVVMLKSKLWSLYFNLYAYELIFAFLSTMGFSIPLSAINPTTLAGFMVSMPSISFSPLSGLAPLSNAHTIVVEAVGTMMIAVLARQVILEFVMNYMYVFFALGAAMRAFIFTRKTGASLLALCAVAYFVYPVAVVFTNYSIFKIYEPTDLGVVPTAMGYCKDPQALLEYSQKLQSEKSALYSTSLAKEETKWYTFWNGLESAGGFIGETGLGISKVFYTFSGTHFMDVTKHIVAFTASASVSPIIFSAFFDFLMIEIQNMVQFMVLIFVSFLLELMIVITSYRSLSTFMEGESEIFGLSKLM